MSFGGNQSTNSSQTTSSTEFDPELKAAFLGNYANAQDVVKNNPMTPYTGQLGATFDGTSMPDAIGAATAGSNFQAPGASAPAAISATGVGTPGSVSASQIAGYMNPYLSDVTDSTAAQMARQNQIDNTNAAAQATAAGAFGGSRSAVLQNLNTDSYQRNLGQTLGNLNMQGYNTALSAAQTDLQRQLQAGIANQSANLQASQSNQNAALQTNLANQNAALQAANVRNTSAGLLGQFGEAQESAQQTGLNAAYQEWLRQQQYPIQMQQLLNQSVGLLPSGTIGNSSSTSNGESDGFNVGLPTSWTTAAAG